MNSSVSVTWGSARPMEELARLIGERQRWLRESAQDAVIATAITTLVSLRALTRTAKGKQAKKTGIVRRGDLRPGYTGGRKAPRRVLRQGAARFAAPRVKWLGAGAKDSELKVFEVRSEHESVKPYLVVARSMTEAKRFERSASRHRTDEYGNLAKWALGVAMNKLSTRNVADNVSGKARLAGSRLSEVKCRGGGDNYEVVVTDLLDYAADALKGGRSAIDLAMMRAANKISGQLAQRAKRTFFGGDFATPFPEAKGGRR